MKKKLLTLLVIGSAVIASSCNKIKEATNQNITLTTAAVTLTVDNKAANSAPAQLSSKVSSAELDALIKQKASGFGINNIKSLKIKTLTAKITDPVNDAANNFANLGAISASLVGNGKTFTANYAGTTTPTYDINFTVDSSIDLKEIASASSITYSLSAPVRVAVTKPITIQLVATYDVVVGL